MNVNCVPRTVLSLLAVLLLWQASPTAANEQYLGLIEAAIASMENGRCADAGEPLRSALTIDANAPLGQCALGVALLHTGQADAALKAYSRALEADPELGAARYGVGIVQLSRRGYGEALDSFRRAATSAPPIYRGADGAIAYTEAVKAGFKSPSGGADPNDPLTLETAAFVKYRQGFLAQARTDVAAILGQAPQFGAAESAGAVASFDGSKPVMFTGTGKLPSALVKFAPKKLASVNGTILLKADTSKLSRPAYVVFHIDGAPAAIVNAEPHEFSWDTTRVPNGIHTVKIVSHDAGGAAVAQREQRVLVVNERAAQSSEERSARETALMDRLWKLTELKPSYWTASYISGRAALAAKDRESAAACFERCVALDPDRADARRLLVSTLGASGPFKEITSVVVGSKLLALTFDDGPVDSTPTLLDILKAADAKATFFIVGAQAVARPDIVRRMIAEGHEVGNHTYSHRNLGLLPRAEVDKELMKGAVVIRSIRGKRGEFVRPPGGHLGAQAKQALADYGLTCALWTFNCGTFEKASAIKYREQVTSVAKPGAILLMHNGDEVTSEALPGILAALKNEGYLFVTLSELLVAAKK